MCSEGKPSQREEIATMETLKSLARISSQEEPDPSATWRSTSPGWNLSCGILQRARDSSDCQKLSGGTVGKDSIDIKEGGVEHENSEQNIS